MLKKIFVLSITIIIVLFSFAGCSMKSKADISSREAVTIIGIDEVNGKIRLTITLELIKPSENDSSGSKVAIYISEGDTMYEAVEKFHEYTNKMIFWGHIDYILIGEDIAKLGINKYLDMFARDHEIKANVRLLVVQGSTAEYLIRSTNLEDAPLNQVLISLFDDFNNLTSNNQVSILDYLQMIGCEKSSLYLPSIKTTDKKVKTGEDKDKKDVMLSGYALFDCDTLVAYLENSAARGLDWIIDKNYSGYITIQDKTGANVVLEVTKAKTKYDVDYSGAVPSVQISIYFKTNIVEYHGKDDIFTDEQIEYLTKEQDKVVEKEVAQTIKFLQKKKLDVIKVCNEIYIKYPKKTYNLQEKWRDLFGMANINVKIESHIDRTYNINQPVAYEEDGGK